jgi:hypothetical protein
MIDPPKWVTNAGGSTSDTMSFDNVGTSTLYVKLSGPSWVTMNPNQFNIIEAGPTQNVNVTLSGAGFTDTILVDSIKIESNDGLVGEVYTNVKWVRIHFVVTDNYYYAEFDTCTRGSVLTVSNVGNLGHQEDSSGMFYKGRNYLFDGTPVMATYADSFGNKGYSYMHDRKDFVANGHLTSVDYPNLKVTVWYDIAFLHNATLPQPYHWLWPGWVKLSKIIQFQNNALPGACVLVWNKWIYSEPPIWWPNYAGPSNPAGGYFGFAADWDVPSDASGKNLGDTIPTLNLAYQYSDSSGFTNYYGGYMFLSASKTKGATTTNYDKPYAVRIGANPTQLYPFKGFNNDSLYKYMSTSGWSIESDSSQDMHIVVSAVQELDPDASSIIRVKYACLVSDQGATGIADLASKMKNQKAGDANVDGKVSVSDVVYLINYLFKGGAEPFVAYSDANGDSKISVSDVVYLINYLFKGGPAPVLVWGAEL